jgi:hypothetical protein
MNRSSKGMCSAVMTSAVGDPSKHPVGDHPQAGPVLVKSLRQPVILIHRHIPLSARVIAMTRETHPSGSFFPAPSSTHGGIEPRRP